MTLQGFIAFLDYHSLGVLAAAIGGALFALWLAETFG